jgi:hypothetical protein
MPSDFTNTNYVNEILAFLGSEAIEVLPQGEYHGRIVDAPHALGANGMHKQWFTVRLIAPSPPDLIGKIVHVGIAADSTDEAVETDEYATQASTS